MSIEGIKFGLQGLRPIPRVNDIIPQGDKISPAGGQPNFQQMLSEAVREVDDLQKQADTMIEGVMLKKEGVNTHDAMIALEKADVAFQMMTQIKGKIVRAYEEIIRTQF